MGKRKKTKTQKAHDKLKAALKRFDADQGMVGRRNARKALSAALTAVRTAVDEEFPAIRKPPKRTGRLTPGLRRRRLKEQNMKCVDKTIWRALKHAGIKVVEDPFTTEGRKKKKAEAERRAKLKKQNKYVPNTALPRIPHTEERWVPKWAIPIQKAIAAADLDNKETARYWERAKKRGNEKQIVEAELYVLGAAKAGLKGSYRRAAIARIRDDREFRDAVIAVGALGPHDTKRMLESQLSLQDLRAFVERKVS